MQTAVYHLRTGPFVSRVEVRNERLREGIELLYDPLTRIDPPEFCDFHVALGSPPLRRWLRPKLEFLFDGRPPFKPSPWMHALPVFEWGLNWAIVSSVNNLLIIHAAAVARNGRAMIIPGPPGAGKSTLCAGLSLRGWRLLSDELTLVRLDGGGLFALARPVSLKNKSIEVIRNFSAEAVMSRPAEETMKGTIVLLKPPLDSVRRVDEPAMPAWVVVPRFAVGSAMELTPRKRPDTFIELAANALNYSVLGARGFSVLGDLIERCACYDFAYGDLDGAVDFLTTLADAAPVG